MTPPTTEEASEVLRTTVLPQASGKTTARSASSSAAFQGEMHPTTPMGWRHIIPTQSGVSEGNICPWTLRTWLAASRRNSGEFLAWNLAKGVAAPVSRFSASTN